MTFELRAGMSAAVIDPTRGGRVASWTVDGEELLVGPPDDTDSSIHWGCYLMAPWPGRLADGRFDWRGRTIQLWRTHGRHAIHGLTWNRAWSIDQVTADTTALSIELPRDEWPMGGRVVQRVRLAAHQLRFEAEIHADDPMPAALGWHPWFRRDNPDPSLRLDAHGLLQRRAMLPTGRVLPLAGRFDLRDGPNLGRRRLDDAWVGARSPAVLRWPRRELRIEFGPECSTVLVYTPWNAICVEPMTASPNALALPAAERRAAGVRELSSGERLEASMTMSVERIGRQ